MDSFDAVGRLRAAAEPTRLRILRLLLNGEFNVKDLTQLLGQSQPRVSRHIRLLAEAGLIERYQEGSWVFVRASTSGGPRVYCGRPVMIAADDPQIVRDRERAAQTPRRTRRSGSEPISIKMPPNGIESDRCMLPSRRSRKGHP